MVAPPATSFHGSPQKRNEARTGRASKIKLWTGRRSWPAFRAWPERGATAGRLRAWVSDRPLGLPKGGAMFARLREMLDRWLEASEGIARQLSEWGLPFPETRRAPRCDRLFACRVELCAARAEGQVAGAAGEVSIFDVVALDAPRVVVVLCRDRTRRVPRALGRHGVIPPIRCDESSHRAVTLRRMGPA